MQSHAESLDADKMWLQGINMKEEAIKNQNRDQFLNGLQLMEKAFSQNKTRGEWCYEIGSCYYYRTPFGNNGNYIAIDEKAGVKWFQKGSKLGEVRCALFLYKQHRPKEEPYSILSPQKEWNDYFKARDKSWEYAAVALQANIPTDFNDYVTLGDAAWFTHNDDLAYKYFAIAADKGEYGAIAYVIKDERALEYLTTPKALFDAGIQMWKRGKDDGDHHDKFNGFKMFEKSAKLNYPIAQKQMGYIYLTGQTVKPDTLKAVSWYKLAASHKLTDAMYILGKLYANGMGIDRDENMAFEYFKGSADNGYVASELPLGFCYLYGIGTLKDASKARTYFQSYYNKIGNGKTDRLLHSNNIIVDLDYLLGLTYYQENSPEAVKLFESSLNNEVFYCSQRADLLYKLASCYSNGKCGVTVNIQRAEELYEQAKRYAPNEIDIQNLII